MAGVVKQVEVVPRKRGQTENRRVRFGKIDNFWKDLIRMAIYEFYRAKIVPILESIINKTEGTVYEFPYINARLCTTLFGNLASQ